MGGGRAAALLSRSSSALHPAAVLSHHLSFRPLLSLRPFRGGAGASSSSVVRMASDAAPPQKESSPASASSSAGAQGSSSSSSSSTSPSSAVDFLTLCHRLKTTKRAGWVRHSIREPESVADHMYRMGVMALISSDLPGVDRERCIKMAIVHDIAEAIVGDITPADGVPKLEKSQREQEALAHMCGLLGGGSRAKEIHDLWMEYEENSSLEAKLVKDFDKVEMILQALEYETEQGIDLDEFFQSTAGIIWRQRIGLGPKTQDMEVSHRVTMAQLTGLSHRENMAMNHRGNMVTMEVVDNRQECMGGPVNQSQPVAIMGRDLLLLASKQASNQTLQEGFKEA